MSVTLLDPTRRPDRAPTPEASRPANLDGAVLGLINNGKTWGREILDRVAANLRERHEIADVVTITKLGYSVPLGEDEAADFARQATAVIAAIGD
ncbi:MAG: hypothetical protein P8J50_05720 [Acidimicrobiales bacterium]|nr:hypothetical protein [Acidimicrobiales bacterium]